MVLFESIGGSNHGWVCGGMTKQIQTGASRTDLAGLGRSGAAPVHERARTPSGGRMGTVGARGVASLAGIRESEAT